MRDEIWDLILARDELVELDEPARRLALRDVAIEAGCTDVAGVVQQLTDGIEGAGPLTGLMHTPGVTDILVNGPRDVWVERYGELERVDISFEDRASLHGLIERLLGRVGSRADASRPIADARLPDGSRLHVVMDHLAPDGPFVSIRLHPHEGLTLEDLIATGSLSEACALRLRDLVLERASLMVCGPTGSGKTTLLGALIAEVPPHQRIVSVEETPELRARHPHLARMVTRPGNLEGRGKVGLEELGRAALRMRPDRIVFGEVRGPEARVALRALTSGHRGSMFTIHAASAAGALERFVDLCCDRSTSERTVRRAVATSLDAVVALDRVDGKRAVTEVLTR